MTRTYSITDDGDEVHLAMFEDGEQVGGGLFPDDGTGEAFELACEVGDDFVGRFNMEADEYEDSPDVTQ